MSDPNPATAVVPLRRPPVRQATVVRSTLAHTFDTFVATIGVWWPLRPFSAGKDRVRAIVFEQRRGGQVYERWHDGTVVVWGDLLAWEPPDRFVLTWNQTPVATEVEITFTALGPQLTRVTVEQRGWENLTDEQLGEDCALPGRYRSGTYATGWTRILERLTAAAEER